jgi:hypothetical protein
MAQGMLDMAVAKDEGPRQRRAAHPGIHDPDQLPPMVRGSTQTSRPGLTNAQGRRASQAPLSPASSDRHRACPGSPNTQSAEPSGTSSLPLSWSAPPARRVASLWQVQLRANQDQETQNGSTKPWLALVTSPGFLYTEGVGGSSPSPPMALRHGLRHTGGLAEGCFRGCG